MGKYYDLHRKEAPMYRVGDKVMLDMRNIKTHRPIRKFDHKKQGPIVITKVISRCAVKLELPRQWKIHDSFHVSLRETYRDASIPGQAQPSPDDVLRDAGELAEGQDAFSDDFTPEAIVRSESRG